MIINGIELEGAALEVHILKFTPGTSPATQPHNAPLWQDINIMFKEYFTEFPNHGIVYIKDAEQLVNDLEARFHGTYDLQHIRKMLQTEYKKDPECGYEFEWSDFIKEVTV